MKNKNIQILEVQDLAKSWIARTWFILVNYIFGSPTFDQFGFELSNELGPKGQDVFFHFSFQIWLFLKQLSVFQYCVSNSFAQKTKYVGM